MLAGLFDKRFRPRYHLPVLSTLIRPLRRVALTAFYRGRRVYCPCCERTFRSFPHLHCPHCASHPRHRLLWLYFRLRWADLFHQPLRVLHFAPEHCLQQQFQRMNHLQYITVDLAEPGVSVHMDMTHLSFPDASMDVILCSHVLEHIADDRLAMRECQRVLRPGGVAFMQIPQCNEMEKTYEDPSVTTPLERERHFGQWDHVRRYGRDFSERLAEAGFDVTPELFGEELAASQGPEVLERFGLWHDRIYVCRKSGEPVAAQEERGAERKRMEYRFIDSLIH